ncbi:vitamin K epoxide reductase family protein [Bacteroides oleiciplenus]|uniref:vitamin K epoxide reductase family protein n=1 Tax=Bacteroides oleiciplenus TaxID=626931 RepID=UPI0026DCBDB2|nr:vitamin K epoxide reductase family protein [Bacteroides oleiciplenus]
MAEVDNTAIVLYCYLRALSVKVSRSTVRRLLDTPLGDGIRGISDALDMLLVKNEVYQLPSSDYFLQLESPFITMLKVDRNPFCVVTKKGDSIVEFIDGDGQKRSMTMDKFLQQWTGTVLFGEPTEKTLNEHYYVMKNIIFYLLRYKFVIAILFILILGMQAAFSQNQPFAFIAYLCTLSFGILVSIAILYKEWVNEQFMESFCHIGKVVNCNEVLHSKGANIAGVGLGELSLLYFAVLFLFSLIRWNDFYGISVICCVAATAFTLYSIIYQVFILHKGCMLCMLVNLAVWGNATTLYMLRNYFDIDFSFTSFSVFIAIGCICLILGIQIRTIQNRERERVSLKEHLGSLFNSETFQMLLALKPQIEEMASLDITLHSQDTGGSEVMIVTNPNCKNCARIHRHVKEIASRIPVSLVFLTFPNDRLGEKIAQIVIAAYYMDGWDKAMQLLEEWYETKCIKEVDDYSITTEVQDLWMKQQVYCRRQRINKTPSVIVSKHYIPEVYPLSDLRYVLT